MKSLSKPIEEYIALRRAYGLRFDQAAAVLRQFALFCAKHGHRQVKIAAILDWAQAYPNSTSLSISRRIRTVRGFASHWKAYDPKTEIPPRELASEFSKRTKPHIYTPVEVQKILSSCNKFEAEPGQSNPIRRETFSTMFGLIASAGLRRSEAINLKRRHVDFKSGNILIEMTKFRKSRLIPIHPTTLAKLKLYAEHRDRVIKNPKCDNFFIMNRGQAVDADSIFYAFVHACKQAGIRPTTEGSGFPRIHDLRHTFVVSVILKWLKDGLDVHTMMPALSTYVGHVEPSDTYWYLTGVPELMRFGLHQAQR